MRIKREQLILLVLAGGFFTMAFEIRQLHRDVISEHWQAQIPIYFSFLGFMAAFAALANQRFLRSVAAALFGLGCVVGFFGLYNHSDGDPNRVVQPFFGAVVARAEDGEDEQGGKRGEKEADPPPLAPMGITGLSAIGLILAWPGKKAD